MVEVKSKFDADLTKAAIRFQVRKLWLLFVLLSIFFTACGFLIVFSPEAESIGLGIFLIVIGVLFFPLCYLLTILMQKNINKSMKIMGSETINNYTFYENIIYQHMERGDIFKETSQYGYVMLYRVFETKTHFFMYISNRQTHVIPKKDITIGTPQELSQFFSINLGKKFKPCK